MQEKTKEQKNSCVGRIIQLTTTKKLFFFNLGLFVAFAIYFAYMRINYWPCYNDFPLPGVGAVIFKWYFIVLIFEGLFLVLLSILLGFLKKEEGAWDLFRRALLMIVVVCFLYLILTFTTSCLGGCIFNDCEYYKSQLSN